LRLEFKRRMNMRHFALFGAAVLLCLAACSSGSGTSTECCVKAGQLKAEIPKCCTIPDSECCKKSKMDPAKKVDCCKKAEELTAKIPDCCKKGEACCSKK
jgi:hypothetical protein